MKSQEFILELRKNPTVNSKLSVNAAIDEALNKNAGKMILPGIENVFVSFTKVDKLGINPKSEFGTPLGIFAYPARYVQELTKDGKDMSALPWAGNEPWANIFSVRGNIVDLNNMTVDEREDYYKKLIDYLSTLSQHGREYWAKRFDSITDKAAWASDFSDYPGGRFWYVTMEISKIVASILKSSSQVAWNTIFRKIGIDGCVDNENTGIIHTNEPTQAVFFSINTIVNNTRLKNSHNYSPTKLKMLSRRDEEQKKFNADTRKMIDSMSSEDQWNWIIQKYQDEPIIAGKYARYIKNPKVRMAMLSTLGTDSVFNKHNIADPNKLIYDMGRLSDNEIKYAIDKDPANIFRVRRPPMWAIEMAVLAGQPKAMRYISNPTEKIQLSAVSQNPSLIEWIDNPSEAVQIAAVSEDPLVSNQPPIKFIKNPTERVQMIVATNWPNDVRYIENPTERVQMAVVTKAPSRIKLINNPTERVQLEAVTRDKDGIKHIINIGIIPSEIVQLAAVKTWGAHAYFIIAHLSSIKNVSEEVKIAAVSKDPNVIQFMVNPSEAVLRAADR